MSEEPKGLRALPPALVLAFAVWLVMIGVRVVYIVAATDPYSGIRFAMVNEGTGFACEVLATLGAFELARRLTGRAGQGALIAAIGFASTIAIDVAYGFTSFMERAWEHEWIFKVGDYAFFVAWLAVSVGVAIACGREKRGLGIAVVAVSLLTWPPPFLAKAMYGWMPDGKTGYAIEHAIRAARLVVLVAGFAAIARGTTVTDRALSASGLRSAGKALWLRVIAAVSVVLLTLMVIGGRGSTSSLEVLQVAIMAAAVINIVALVMFGVGGVRAARGSIAELGRWPLVLGGAASLWAAGVTLGQVPWLYKMLYKHDSVFGSSELTKYAQALSVAMPVVVTVGVGLIAIAIGHLAARRGRDELVAHAQAKGAGFVTLTLVSLAIQAGMIPNAKSIGSFAMLSLLTAGCGFAATVMMAKLCGLGADELERDAGLPSATVVSGGAP